MNLHRLTATGLVEAAVKVRSEKASCTRKMRDSTSSESARRWRRRSNKRGPKMRTPEDKASQDHMRERSRNQRPGRDPKPELVLIMAIFIQAGGVGWLSDPIPSESLRVACRISKRVAMCHCGNSWIIRHAEMVLKSFIIFTFINDLSGPPYDSVLPMTLPS